MSAFLSSKANAQMQTWTLKVRRHWRKQIHITLSHNIPCTANVRWRRANPVCFIFRKRTPPLLLWKIFAFHFRLLRYPSQHLWMSLQTFNQSHLLLQLHFPNNQCWKSHKYATFCGCIGVKCRSIEYRPHWKLEQIPCSACCSCYKQSNYQKLIKSYVFTHVLLHVVGKRSGRWRSCWSMQQKGMPLHSSLSSLWPIREAVCWQQLSCDLDNWVSLSCWHHTLMTIKHPLWLTQPRM